MDIPLDKLQAVKKIIVHGSCPDGLASAILLDEALPGREVVFALHNTTVVQPEPGLLYCDYCPPADQLQAFRDAGTIVLDHHKSVEAAVRSFKYHDFADEVKEPGVSGAVVAFRSVWQPFAEAGFIENADMPFACEFSRLAGLRDTWQKQDIDFERGSIQAEMLLLFPENMWLGQNMLKPANRTRYSERFELARMTYSKKLAASKKLAGESFSFITAKGTSVAVVGARYISDAADFLNEAGHELAIGFSYTATNGELRMILSTRSRGNFDCSALCKFYNGGGHTAAAGCTIPVSLDDPNPFARIHALVEKYESTLD